MSNNTAENPSKSAVTLRSVRCVVFAIVTLCACAAFGRARADAPLQQGQFRLSLDTDLLAFGGVVRDADGPGGRSETAVIGFGPNQLGNSRANGFEMPTTGLGFGYTLTPRLILGLRTALGFDVVDGEGNNDKTRILGIALLPGITWVPIGRTAKLFVSGSPLFQANRAKNDDNKTRMLLGGFSAGVGTLIFPANAVSADLGFFFEGRFGGQDDGDDLDVKIRDLRGIVRIGLSLWR